MASILFPQLGDRISSATVVRWLKHPGDQFAAGDSLVELEAEQAMVVVEATQTGKLGEILASPGRTVAVGAELARVATTTSPQPAEAAPVVEKTVTDNRVSDSGKVIPILMPQAGNTMEEGTVISWRVNEGDLIAVGQVLCEIETDKATMDFESPDAGRLARIVAPIGVPVAVKELIALLAESAADADAFLAGRGKADGVSAIAAMSGSVASPANAVQNRSRTPVVVSAEGRVKASPAARKIAAERGVTLASVGAGSGPGGRILSSDVNGATVAATAPAAVGNEVRRPLSKMRRAIGLNLQQSKQTVPHFYVRTTIDAGPLLEFYREQKATVNCTLNDVIVLAVGRAMHEFPAVRSQIVGSELVEYPHANIGIAVGVDEGLVVPVVLSVDTQTLPRLAAETKRIIDLARKGRLENIGKGHFTISNLGMFGVEEFSAIINPPESGILAVSATREAAIVENGAIRAGHSMTMTLSADHRIVDGVMAAKFMQRLQAILEHPGTELA